MINKKDLKSFWTDRRKIKAKKSAANFAVGLFRFVLLFGISFVILYPILSMICGSFMSTDDLIDITVKYFPKHFNLDNYKKAIVALDMPSSFITSLVIFAITAALQVLACTMVGYGLARYKFKLNGLVFAFVIIQLLIPPDTIMLTRNIHFRYFSFLGISNLLHLGTVDLTATPIPLFLLGITCTGLKNGLFIFMLRQYFKGLPKSLEEAAYVDGSGPLHAFVTIMLPCAKTMMTTVFLFSFVWLWTDLTIAPTLTTGNIIVNNLTLLKTNRTEQLSTSLMRNAGIVLIIIPVLLLYLICQRSFVQGVETSGLTGT